MRLTRVEIEGYRSISDKVDFHVDRDVTVLLGANDHGKTNILSALLHVNADDAFEDTDLNWDRAADPDNFPCITFHFYLEAAEREQILSLSNEELAQEHEAQLTPASPTPPKSAKSSPAPVQDPEAARDDDEAAEPEEVPPQPQLALHQIRSRCESSAAVWPVRRSIWRTACRTR